MTECEGLNIVVVVEVIIIVAVAVVVANVSALQYLFEFTH